MPYPIWSNAADCVSAIMQHHLPITPEQDRSIRIYVQNLPVRRVLGLLITLKNAGYASLGHAVYIDDQSVLEGDFDGLTTDDDQYMVIINALRIILGRESWYTMNSDIVVYASRYLQTIRDMEEHIGFDHDTLERMRYMLTEFAEPQSDDDEEEGGNNDNGSELLTTERIAEYIPAALQRISTLRRSLLAE